MPRPWTNSPAIVSTSDWPPGAGEFLKWIGLEQPQPLALMRASILAIQALLRGDAAGGAPPRGALPWTRDAYLRFKAPRATPIYLGAMSPGMLRLAGELCDGVLPLLFPPEHYYTVRPLVAEGLARRTAPAPAFDLAACIWVSLDADRALARQALAKKIAYYGHALSPLIYERLGVSRGDFRPIEQTLVQERDEAKAAAMVSDAMLRIGVVGDAGDLLARLRPLIAAGARHLSFGPPLGPDPLRAIEYMGRAVLPALRV